MELDAARWEVVRAALSYQASVMGDETNAHYGDEVELKGEVLDEAVAEYMTARREAAERRLS